MREAAVGSLSILQFFSSTSYENEQGKDDNKDDNEDNNEDDNEGMTEKEKKIANAIEFVNKVIHEEKLSEAEKARYTATLYFLRLLFNGKKKSKLQRRLLR